MHSRGGSCPQCNGYTGLSIEGGDDPTMFQHKTPYENRCPAGGIKRSQAEQGWTALSLRTYEYLLANRPEEAPEFQRKILEGNLPLFSGAAVLCHKCGAPGVWVLVSKDIDSQIVNRRCDGCGYTWEERKVPCCTPIDPDTGELI